MTDHTPAPKGHWAALAALLEPFRGRVAALGALAALGATLPLAGPLLLRSIIDRAVAGEATRELLIPATAYMAIAVTAQVMAILVLWAATRLTWRVTDSARVELTDHILRHDIHFHHQHTPGELVERVDGDLTAVSEHLASFAVTLMGVFFTIAGMLVVVTLIDWRLGVALAIYAAVAITAFSKVRDRAVAEAERERGAMAQLYSGIEERLVGIDDIRANGAGDHAMACFNDDARGAYDAAIQRERQIVWLWHAATGAVAGGAVFSLAMGAIGVNQGWITVGTAFLLFQYTQLMQAPLDQIIEQLQEIQKAAGAMLRVRQLLLSQPEPPVEHGPSLNGDRLSITFEAVDFSYGDEPVLQGVDFTLGAGRSLGVVGATGAGKTTIGRLLTRTITPTAGQLRIGSHDIADIAEADLRHHIGVVPQDVLIFSASVRDNVTLFDRTYTDAAVLDALDKVGLGGLCEGPDGLNAHLTGNDGGLSAGEAQLLALSRVFLRDPAIVLLDEATSRVDPDTEQQVLESISALLEGRTSVVIAHRLSTLERVDEIALLKDGVIAEHDARETLLANDSTYARLVALTAGNAASS